MENLHPAFRASMAGATSVVIDPLSSRRPKNPNELCDELVIRPRDMAAGCEFHLSDRRYQSRIILERPASVMLRGPGFDAVFNASYEDLVAIRNWASKAVAAMDAQEEDRQS